MKSYRMAPIAPPIIGPTQYTCQKKRVTKYFIPVVRDRFSTLLCVSYPVVDEIPHDNSRSNRSSWVHASSSVVHLNQRQTRYIFCALHT